MASTAFSLDLLNAAGLNLDDIDFSFGLDSNFLAMTSLDILGEVAPTLVDDLENLSESLVDISGDVVITSGLVESNLVLADGPFLVGSIDLPATLMDLADLAAITNGTFTLADGLLNAEITTGDESLTVADLDLAVLASTAVLNTFNLIEGTVPFENGAFLIDIDTVLGNVSGTIDVGGGDLNIDLITPLGEIAADLDFEEEALYPFTVPLPGLGSIDAVVDFNSGNIVAPLGLLGNLTVPIDTISGSLSLADGTATLNAEIPVAGGAVPVSTDIALGPLASEYVAGLVQDLTATGTITNGVLEASVESPLGTTMTTFDWVAFANQGASFFAGVDGLITFDEGLLTATLTTPLGDVNGSLDLGSIAGQLDVPLMDVV